MKFFPWILAVSLTANVLMAALWLKGSLDRAEHPSMKSHASAAPRSASQPAGEIAAPGTAPARGASEIPAAMSWKDLRSDDLKELIRHLRAVDCPEETIQDLVLAEVNRRFEARSRQLWPERFEEQPFWKIRPPFDVAENKKNRERWRAERDLRKEKSELLVELLGVDPQKERNKADGIDDWQDWQAAKLDFLPEAKREAVSKYLDDYNDRMQEFYDWNRGLFDEQYRTEQKQMEAARLQGLAQLLTPQELREYDLRESQTANQLSHDLRTLSLTREQYEAIFDIRKKYGDSIYNYGDVETKEARDQVAETKKAMDAEIAGAWGPEKAREYERSQDYSYQQIAQLAKRNDLPADVAVKVYDFKDAAEKSAKQVREDKSLTPEQRDVALKQIRAETEKTVQAVLPEPVYKKYLGYGGWWINSLAPSSSPSPPRSGAAFQ
jgi:hypothetical protein